MAAPTRLPALNARRACRTCPPGSDVTGQRDGLGPDPGLLHDASAIYQDAAARGERLSQRTLARQLRGHGHRFPNEHLRQIADSIGLTTGQAA